MSNSFPHRLRASASPGWNHLPFTLALQALQLIHGTVELAFACGFIAQDALHCRSGGEPRACNYLAQFRIPHHERTDLLPPLPLELLSFQFFAIRLDCRVCRQA